MTTHLTRAEGPVSRAFAQPETAVARAGTGNGSAARAADWLCLAATPTFAIMALLTVLAGGPDMACAAVHEASPPSGMAAMYLLMSAFHAAPWLRLIPGRRSGAKSS
jgi:hypothetical protein